MPRFQREFVWDTSAIAALATSVIDAYPIGMITLWEQSDRNPLDLERLTIQDYDAKARKQVTKRFGEDAGGQKLYAILDGRQRCTALAMAFAGFTPQYGKSKYNGRYFLNAAQPDPLERIIFRKTTDLEKAGLTTSTACIAQGLFPLASDIEGESVLRQWYRYAQEIRDPQTYPGGELPDPVELKRRDSIVQSAFDGINETRLAACIVPEKYDLGQICEIFETLNLSGMKVSTVDLINSWIYRETEGDDGSEGLHIRDWVRDFGQIDGAVGWAVPERRPELIAQFVTAAFVALERADKPKPRQVGGNRKVTTIDSIKSPDLLATPAAHWEAVVANQDQFATFLSDFQFLVAGGHFSYDKCPYPISASIYVAIRWHKAFDPPGLHSMWNVADLNSLYRAFFWRNALATRYDQGFLTRLATDLASLKKMLRTRGNYETKSAWLHDCDAQLEAMIDPKDVPSREAIIDLLTDGRPGGAKQSALLLPMIAGTSRDIEGVDISLTAEGTLELHHIFPRAWCADNASGPLKAWLDKDQAGRDWVNSIANLMPLARETNNDWKTKSPRTYIETSKITFETGGEFFQNVFIGPDDFAMLTGEPEAMPSFWQGRAANIADDLLRRTRLSV